MSQANICSMGCSRLGEDEQEASWGNDKLKRESYAKRLTTLIQNTRGPYVIGLTSPWGSGKTFFLRAWERDLVEQKKPCVYFNAWKSDITGDPLLSLMATIEEQLTKKGFILPEFSQLLINVIEDIPIISKLGKGLGAMLGNPYVEVGFEAGGQLVEYAKSKIANNIKFQVQLEKLAKNITEIFGGFPLFIMVDELDRCRPEYAITLLERIKHLFQVPGVVFLLAIDATQLLLQVEHTFGLKKHPWGVEKIQGESIDPRVDYLGKFFDAYYSLPSPDIKSFVKMYLENMKELTRYNKIFSEKTKLPLPDLLTGDHLLFEGKSLRLILQDLEYFSIFLRAYDGLSFEEVFVAFYVIINNKNKIFDIKSNTVDMKEKLIKIFNEINSIYNKRYGKFAGIDAMDINIDDDLVRIGLGDAAYCANIFLRFMMVMGNGYELSDAEQQMATHYIQGEPMVPMNGPRALTPGINCEQWDIIEKSLYSKLKLLEDFSSVVPSD